MKPCRIIHVSNFGFKPVRVYLHGLAVKLSNGWIRSGHHVINFSDRDLARWTGLGFRKLGAARTNKLLLDLCKRTRPDVVVFGHADIITRETIDTIRGMLPDAKMFQWNGDWLVPGESCRPDDPTAENNRKKILGKQAALDATFITTAGNCLKDIAAKGHTAAFFPNVVDLSIERGRNFEAGNLPYDVFFASNSEKDWRFHCGAWREMSEFCHDMQRELPELSFSLHGVNNTPKVFGADYQDRLEKCAVGLNISRRNDDYLYSSDRLAHLIGNGLAVCIDRATGYGDIFGDDEMVFYGTEHELFEKLAQLKKDGVERQNIARRGWERYRELFDSSIVAQYMLDVVFQRLDSKKYPWLTAPLQKKTIFEL